MQPTNSPKSFGFEFDSTNRILKAAFSNVVTDEDISNFYPTIAQYSAALDPLAGVLDLSSVTSFEVSVQTIRNLARLDPAMPHPERPRFIVADSSHIFGLARIFEFEGERTRPNLHVVRSLREAWAALGVREPQFDPVPPLDRATSNLNFAS